MIMYVYDRRWLDKGQKYPLFPKHPGEEVDSCFVNKEHKIATIALFIRRRAKGRKISLLRLFGHGNSGWMQMGKGLDTTTAVELAPLRGLMAPGARVELHGCGAASAMEVARIPGTNVCTPGADWTNSPGRRFLKAIAQAVQKPVTAGIFCQYEDVKVEFEGPTITEYP